MIWCIYNVLFTIGFTLALPHYLMRMKRRGGYRKDFMERLGLYARDKRMWLSEGGRVWVHAVSVGEVYVALHLMAVWRRKQPDVQFVLTVTTSTGHAVAEQRLDERDVLAYFPVDMPLVILRVLRLWKPEAIVLIETELWPNLIRMASDRLIPVYIANGRLSDRSFKNYRKIRFLTRRLLPLLRGMGMQSEQDAERMRALGAPSSSVRVFGSAKYDVAVRRPDAEKRACQVLVSAGFRSDDFIVLGGSTWPGEEEALLKAFEALRKILPTARMILAPRHVERVPSCWTAWTAHGSMRFIRRSRLPRKDLKAADVLVLDSTGELQDMYAVADVVFIGKSLHARGGQNPLEAAVYGKPIITGPYMDNFRAVMEHLRSAGAVREVRNDRELAAVVTSLAGDATERKALGGRVAAALESGRGAVRSTVEMIL